MIENLVSLEYVLPLANPDATLERVGGKGASLARMLAAGFPVPDGFHITTSAYRMFVTANDLQPRIQEALAQVNVADPRTLEKASRAIKRLFDQAKIPAEIASEIVQSYGELPGIEPAVAVRSSATAEDLPEASFAGQQESYLNVSGAGALLEATQKCWASLWTARAIGYRARQGIVMEGVALAVVVQLLVPAEAAGILFTVNPINGLLDQMVISAAWGLGEAVVGGMVTPDTVTVEKATGLILEQQIADKQIMTVRVDGSTEEQPVPENLRRVPVLGDETAAELSQLAVQIETLFGMPMDIEWVLADGQFFIVQARPVTALPEPEAKPPADWPLPHPKGQYLRASIIELMPDPLTPLFATMGIPIINTGLQGLLDRLVGTPEALPDDTVLTINDYAYMRMNFTLKQWWLLVTRLGFAFPRMLRTGEQRLDQVAYPYYHKAIAKWEKRPLHTLAANELLTGARELLDGMAHLLTTLQSSTMGAAAGSETLFTRVYERMVKRQGDPDAPVFLLGYDSIPIQAEKALYDLAQWCLERTNLTAYLKETPAATLTKQWEAEQTPAGVDAEDWRQWQDHFRKHLDRYGHSIYDLDFAKPVPADEPSPILELLKMYLSGQGANPHERQQQFARRREQVTEETLTRLKGLKLKIFRKVLGWAQHLAPLREDGIANIGLGYPLLRRMLCELGRQVAQAGAITQADDIFWMYEDEVKKAAIALDQNMTLPEIDAQVQQRKALWRAERRLTPPPQLPPSKKVLGVMDADIWLAASAEDQTGETIKGVGASPGRVTAAACVLLGPQDFCQMQPGCVLVAGITTPAWTPLFAMASAVVTDIGGPLSHGSIVAREYGIPAVLGTGVATHRIRSGQIITVDGNAGTVSLSNNIH
jgi:phosphoenolpyruvate synthase/pyruvate phosphate dikinase